MLEVPEAYKDLPDEHLNWLATSLAEKLGFRVCAVLEWVEKTKITVGELAAMHRQLNIEGVCGELSGDILVAVVNNISLEKVEK